MKDDLERLTKKERPETIREVQRTAEMGDFSENFAYQQAKHALRRINDRILTLEEKLKVAIPIKMGSSDGRIRIGSTVTVETNGKSMTFEIVGSSETNPSRGRISHASPLGSALLGHVVGDEVLLGRGEKQTAYLVKTVR